MTDATQQQLLYNVSVSSVQQRESAINACVYMQPLFLGFPSHPGHHGAVSRAPCAVRPVLISHLFYTQ